MTLRDDGLETEVETSVRIPNVSRDFGQHFRRKLRSRIAAIAAEIAALRAIESEGPSGR